MKFFSSTSTTCLVSCITAAVVVLISCTIVSGAATTRDPLKQPFASSSIWNMPIGSGASYVAAGLSGTPGPAGDIDSVWAHMPGYDEEHLLLNAKAPLTPIYYSAVGWGGGDRCTASTPKKTIATVPIPATYTIPNGIGNTASVHLMSDGRTIMQFQPTARCTPNSYATAYVGFPSVDLYGNGISGAHGGSYLSSFGGSLRLGELRPSGGLQGPRHVLKVNVYAKEALYKCTTPSACYRWPASTADSYAVGRYGTGNNNQNTAVKMGSLLAIPATTNISKLSLETQPAKQLAWTLQNYGAYIVDDTYAPGFDFSIEAGPQGRKAAEFKADYGFDFYQTVNYASSSAWVRDMQRLVRALYVVNNNSPTTIGGGGTPRQSLAPAISPPVALTSTSLSSSSDSSSSSLSDSTSPTLPSSDSNSSTSTGDSSTISSSSFSSESSSATLESSSSSSMIGGGGGDSSESSTTGETDSASSSDISGSEGNSHNSGGTLSLTMHIYQMIGSIVLVMIVIV